MSDAKFASPKDLNFFKAITADVADLFLREVEFRVIDRNATVVDPQYTESKNIKYISFMARAQMDIKPKKTKLTKFGIDEARDLIVTVEASILSRGDDNFPNGFPIPGEGDLIMVVGDLYEIMDQQEMDYWWHSETNFTYAFFLNRLRERSINDNVLVDPMNPAGRLETPSYATKDDPYPGEPT